MLRDDRLGKPGGEQIVFSRGDRSAGEHNVSSDCIDRERAFMQKNFQHRKVRDAEAGRGDTSGIDLCESAVSLHENQPEMNTGSVGRAGLRIVHDIIFISRYFLRKIFLEGKEPAKNSRTQELKNSRTQALKHSRIRED